jgi:hypothetical protein
MKEVEYKEHYLVYPDGRIWLKRVNRFSKLSHDSHGYIRVGINGKYESVHRIVAICFSSNPFNKPEVNHWDGIKSNNHILNLVWSTTAENNKHSRDVLGNTKGYRPVIATHILTGKTHKFPSITECAKVLNLNRGKISNCLIRRQKTHRGYTFQYI